MTSDHRYISFWLALNHSSLASAFHSGSSTCPFSSMLNMMMSVWPTGRNRDFPISKPFPWRIRMYAIYGNIHHQYTPVMLAYTIHGSYGIVNCRCSEHLQELWFSYLPSNSASSMCVAMEELAQLLVQSALGISKLDKELLEERLQTLSPFDSGLLLKCISMFLGPRNSAVAFAL